MSEQRLTARPRALAALASAVLGASLLAGCSGDASGGDEPDATTSPEAQAAELKVTTNVPRRTNVPVDLQLAVTVANGTFQDVVVQTSGETGLSGRLSDDKTRWVAEDRLEPGTAYTVVSTAQTPDGETEKVTRRFSTVDLTLDQQTWADVAPLNGETVGVGMPVVVTFDLAVTDKAAMERHMKVASEPAQKGAWHWLNDNEVHWRPAKYWQAGTDVTVDLDINSVDAGGGIYGQESRHIEFSIGDAHIYKVNARTHQMQVFSNGQLLRTIPITTGKEGFITRSGVKVIIEKFRERRMRSETVGIAQGDPEYYDIDDVEYAMRLTWSGEFIHAAPWSVGSQGQANVSHGCTGMSTEAAGWLYNMTLRGDVVEYVGTDRPMEFANGWGDWNLDFPSYAEGSALA